MAWSMTCRDLEDRAILLYRWSRVGQALEKNGGRRVVKKEHRYLVTHEVTLCE